MVTTDTSKWGFTGWSLKGWLKHNKETIKAAILFVTGYNFLVGFSWESFLIGLAALAGKCLIDTIDYCTSE